LFATFRSACERHNAAARQVASSVSWPSQVGNQEREPRSSVNQPATRGFPATIFSKTHSNLLCSADPHPKIVQVAPRVRGRCPANETSPDDIKTGF
jgi:hypothetical protein